MRTDVAHYQGDVFARAFGAGQFQQVLALRRKAHAKQRAAAAACGRSQRRQDVGVFYQVQLGRQAGAVFFDFVLRRVGASPIGHRCCGNQDVAGVGLRLAGLQHVLRGAHIDTQHPARRRQRHRPGHQRDLRAGLPRRTGNGKAHLAAGEVADTAHRVHGLKSRPGGDQNPPTLQHFGLEMGYQVFQNFLGFEHAPVALFATGLVARAHIQHKAAVGAQLRNIALGGRVRPHFPVHGGRDQQGHGGNRTGQAQEAEQIVGAPVQQFGHEVGAGRGDQHRVGFPGQIDMRHIVVGAAVPLRIKNRPPAQSLHGHRRDELRRCLSHHDLHRSPFLDHGAAQLSGLVAGDAAAEAQNNVFALQVHGVACARFLGFCGYGLTPPGASGCNVADAYNCALPAPEPRGSSSP